MMGQQEGSTEGSIVLVEGFGDGNLDGIIIGMFLFEGFFVGLLVGKWVVGTCDGKRVGEKDGVMVAQLELTITESVVITSSDEKFNMILESQLALLKFASY